jgi:hypothetical protein
VCVDADAPAFGSAEPERRFLVIGTTTSPWADELRRYCDGNALRRPSWRPDGSFEIWMTANRVVVGTFGKGRWTCSVEARATARGRFSPNTVSVSGLGSICPGNDTVAERAQRVADFLNTSSPVEQAEMRMAATSFMDMLSEGFAR